MTETHNPYTEPCRSCKFLKQEPAESSSTTVAGIVQRTAITFIRVRFF